MTRREVLMAPAAALAGAPQRWTELGYGMFLHFGPNTLQGTAWGDGKFPAEKFRFPKIDTAQWAAVAKEAGMRYAVLTAKHHDGFCLWPSRETAYSVKTAGAPDVVGEYANAFGKAGLKVGLYYSLWDRNSARYEDDAAYAEYMRAQIRELLTEYGDVVELWFDGAWDKDFPTRKWPFDPAWLTDPNSGLRHGERWEWEALYSLIHSLQPDCLVANNSSSDRPGQVRYFPCDLRTCEHFHFIWRGKECVPVLETMHRDKAGKAHYLPLEYCESLTPGWFWKKDSYVNHAAAETIAYWHRTARSTRSNLLLNVGPDDQGVIPAYHVPFLTKARRMMRL